MEKNQLRFLPTVIVKIREQPLSTFVNIGSTVWKETNNNSASQRIANSNSAGQRTADDDSLNKKAANNDGEDQRIINRISESWKTAKNSNLSLKIMTVSKGK